MKKGFTLAEILITLGVIGVVAALTMPNLIGNYQTKILETQLQRTYNIIRTAVVNSMQTEVVGSIYDASWSYDRDAKVKFFNDYFNTTTTCTEATGYSKCLASNYRSYDKKTQFDLAGRLTYELSVPASDVACAVLESGATVCAGKYIFLMDVNGVKEPNTIGKDVFSFGLQENGKPKFDIANNSEENAAGDSCYTGGTSVKDSGCMSTVITDGWKIK